MLQRRPTRFAGDVTLQALGIGTSDRDFFALATIDPLTLNNRSAFGEQLVASLAPKAAWRFDYGTAPNTRLYTTTTANGGSIGMSASRVQLITGTNVAGMARIQSQRRLRYMPGMGSLVRFTAVYAAPKASSTQWVGQGDTEDGFFFGYSGTDFGVMRRRAAVDDFTPQASWNGHSVSITPQNGNVYQIRYQWLGYGFIHFYILQPSFPDLGWQLVHTILYPNTTALTSILNPTLPLMAEAANTGNNTSLTLMTASGLAALEGETSEPFNPLNVGNSFDASASFADTNNNHMVTIRNKTTFGGVANRVPVHIDSINMARGATANVLSTIRLYRNATTAGALTFADVDTNNSPVETSITTTTITGGTVERTYLLTDQVTLQTVEYNQGELVLQPGESLTIGIQNSLAPATPHVETINWLEAF